MYFIYFNFLRWLSLLQSVNFRDIRMNIRVKVAVFDLYPIES